LAKLVFSFLLLFKVHKKPTIVVEVQLAGAEDQAHERRAGDFQPSLSKVLYSNYTIYFRKKIS